MDEHKCVFSRDGKCTGIRDPEHNGIPLDAIYAYSTKTLRDEIAMAALCGWGIGKKSNLGDHQPDYIAESCYAIAAAMLKERNRNDR